jgi:hypothetical protein
MRVLSTGTSHVSYNIGLGELIASRHTTATSQQRKNLCLIAFPLCGEPYLLRHTERCILNHFIHHHHVNVAIHKVSKGSAATLLRA